MYKEHEVKMELNRESTLKPVLSWNGLTIETMSRETLVEVVTQMFWHLNPVQLVRPDEVNKK